MKRLMIALCLFPLCAFAADKPTKPDEKHYTLTVTFTDITRAQAQSITSSMLSGRYPVARLELKEISGNDITLSFGDGDKFIIPPEGVQLDPGLKWDGNYWNRLLDLPDEITTPPEGVQLEWNGTKLFHLPDGGAVLLSNYVWPK